LPNSSHSAEVQTDRNTSVIFTRATEQASREIALNLRMHQEVDEIFVDEGIRDFVEAVLVSIVAIGFVNATLEGFDRAVVDLEEVAGIGNGVAELKHWVRATICNIETFVDQEDTRHGNGATNTIRRNLVSDGVGDVLLDAGVQDVGTFTIVTDETIRANFTSRTGVVTTSCVLEALTHTSSFIATTVIGALASRSALSTEETFFALGARGTEPVTCSVILALASSGDRIALRSK
jgi:hypothetical protein